MIVNVENLVKRYGDLLALDHLSFKVEQGEVYGLLGPNGSGKTTAINCMLALLNFDKGEIKLFDKKMKPSCYDIKSKIGIIPQEVAVFKELTVYQNIDFFCGLYIKDKKLRQEYVKDAIDFVGLNDFVKFVPKKLSGGLKRRLNIACGIAHKPELIILDEPTVAVDPQSRNSILEGIQKLNKNGSTIIYTSHYMEEVEQICTRIGIMDQGKMIAQGTCDELKAMVSDCDKIVIQVYSISEKALESLNNLSYVKSAIYEDGNLSISTIDKKSRIGDIVNFLNENKIKFGSVQTKTPTLNDVFLEITGKQLRD